MQTTTMAATGLILLLTAFGSAAEMRVWTDRNGNSQEAQFIQMAGSKVMLETADGKRITVPKKGLCDEDLEYLSNAVPPTLKIDVDVNLDRDKQGNGYYHERTEETVSCKVSIRKTNRDPCARAFKVCVYLLAKEKNGDRRQIAELHQQSLRFETGDAISLDASTTIRSETGYSWANGYRYEGYLVCVTDEGGNVIAVETNKNTYEAHLKSLLKGSKGTVFTDSFVQTG